MHLFQSKSDSKSSDYANTDDRKDSVPKYFNEKDDNVGETNPEVRYSTTLFNHIIQ